MDIQVLDMPLLDTSAGKDLLGAFISDLVLQLLSFVAENKRQYIRKRQAEGIAAAKARGVHIGRPRLPLPEDFLALAGQWREGLLSTAQLAARCGMCESTVLSRMEEAGSTRESA